MTSSECQVRSATEDDIPSIFALVKELADYEKLPHEVKIDEEYYRHAMRDGLFESIVAVKEGEIMGTCIFFTTFSTWKGKMLHLEDFVVKESERRTGVGKLLFESFLKIAKDKECKLVKWQVIDWNEPAIAFYKKYNAIIDKTWWDCKIIFE